jgi:MYXO-CTERM domain-containing protein
VGTDPLDADTDGDGVVDGIEVRDGTDPLVDERPEPIDTAATGDTGLPGTTDTGPSTTDTGPATVPTTPSSTPGTVPTDPSSPTDDTPDAPPSAGRRCGCSSTPAAPWWALLPGVVGLARRRRRC